MGNAVNMRPELFKCVVAAVPFVDMMVSMCDSLDSADHGRVGGVG